MSKPLLPFQGKVLALCGGVGGAKLAWGLAQVLAPDQLSVVVNTGDDFTHLGLHISPDLDTVMYTLAGISHPGQGWGLAGESWQFMTALEQLGGETWFRLGDRDLATHVLRTQLLAQGNTLTETTAHLCSRLGVQHRVLPMCNQPLRTRVGTDAGELAFQDYFVRCQCRPAVSGLRYDGAGQASLSHEVRAALADPALRAVIVCPSNPMLSIAPLLQVPDLREALENTAADVVVVSPLVGGEAVKGPTAKMMRELQIPTHSASIAAFYADILDVLVIDVADSADRDALRASGVDVRICNTLMKSDADKRALALQLLAGLGKCDGDGQA